MAIVELLEQLKINVKNIFDSKNIGESQTRGIYNNIDAIISLVKGIEKSPIEEPKELAPKTSSMGINIQVKKK